VVAEDDQLDREHLVELEDELHRLILHVLRACRRCLAATLCLVAG
jgi:hypothetical protein